MATTALGTPYVESSDLVANYPAVSLALATEIDTIVKIREVLSAAKTDTFTTASSSFVDVTGLSVNITPTSATSKILIVAQVTAGANNADNNGGYGLRLTGGNSVNFVGDAAGSRTRSIMGRLGNGGTPSYGPGNTTDVHTLVYLDSPATASVITYKVQMRSSSGSAHVNRSGQDVDSAAFNRGASSITVMEIMA
jgi:hypothetical protein